MELSNALFQYLILAIVVLVAFNIVTLVIVFGTGIGKRVVQRIKQRWLYKQGKHVNILFLRRNHVSHEMFIKKEDDGSFLINDQKYAVNPLATFLHDGIPTQINKEGEAEAFNIYHHPQARAMSTAELENIIMSNENEGLGALIKKMVFWIIILIGVAIIAAGAAAYFGFKLNDYIIAKQLLTQSIQQAQMAAQNLTMVMPR